MNGFLPCLPASPVLSSKEVHIWYVSLEQLAIHSPYLSQILSKDERARAIKYRFDRDRQEFIVRRSLLRTILSQYLSVEPSRVQFGYGPYGKPHLAGEFDNDLLQFNLAHSHELAVYAFTHKRQVGVDLEYIQPLSDIERISSQFFTAQENRKIRELDSSARLLAFYHCWTRKEAYVKAVGTGLTQPLDQFEVSVEPDKPAQFMAKLGRFVGKPANGKVDALG